MSTRNRMTWAAGRSASAPPATPGYGKEDQDHPAHQADPAYEAYKKGDPSAWAEDPKKAPYPQGNPPSLPGYDVEDQDHPAHKEQPRVPKEARGLRAAVERKAQKCIRIARHMLGKKATQQAIEDQALDMMDWSDTRINATLERLGGGFMAEEEPQATFFDEFDDFSVDPVDPVMDVGFPADDDLDLLMAEEAPEDGKKSEIDGLMAEIQALTAKVEGLKAAGKQADQNDPNGKTLAPTPKSEEQARKEAKKAEGEEESEEEAPKEETAARKAARKFFASMDHDRDGFVVEADWTGNKELFAALDTDGDGILAAAEVINTLAPAPAAPVLASFTAEEAAMLAAMEASVLKAASKKAKKAEDEEEEAPKAAKKGGKKSEDEEPEADKKGGKKAKKAEDEEEEAPKAGKKATTSKKADEDEDDEEPEEDEGGEEPEEDEGKDKGDEETASKKACGEDDAGMFGMSGDPMGLADGSEDVLGEDDALLAEIFGGKKAGEEEEEGDKPEGDEEADKQAAKKSEDEEPSEEEPSEEEKAAAKKAMRLASQRPQPRKPSTGVRTVGGLTRTASAGGEVDELSRLWESAPDVSKVFG